MLYLGWLGRAKCVVFVETFRGLLCAVATTRAATSQRPSSVAHAHVSDRSGAINYLQIMLGLVAIIAASAAAAATLRSGPTTEAFRGWTSTGRSDSAKQMDLVLGLQLQNVDALEQALYAVSTPGNPRYLKHMSQ